MCVCMCMCMHRQGRMILSDVLALASRKVNKPVIHGAVFGGGSSSFSPRLLVDYATLTGNAIFHID